MYYYDTTIGYDTMILQYYDTLYYDTKFYKSSGNQLINYTQAVSLL